MVQEENGAEEAFAQDFCFCDSGDENENKEKGQSKEIKEIVKQAKAKFAFDEDLFFGESSDGEDFNDEDADPVEDHEGRLRFEDAPVSPVTSFEAMGLSPVLLKAIKNVLHYTNPTPIQSIAVPVGLTGRDICGAAETGSGKTAAFLIPAMERLLHKTSRVPGCRILVLLPTRELAKQCVDTAEKLLRMCPCGSIKLIGLIGGEPLNEQRALLIKNKPDVVIATPGRLLDHLKQTPSFSLDHVDVLILDEADRMLEAGFEDELKEIVQNCPRSRQTLLFSATMTDKVDTLAGLSLQRPVKLFIDSPGMLPQRLEQHFVKVKRESDRLALLFSVLFQLFNPKRRNIEPTPQEDQKDPKLGKTVIFLPTKELCHRVAIMWTMMPEMGEAVELHGSLDQATRTRNLDAFRHSPSVRVLIATDVAGRGLDVQGVNLVVNYSMPPALAPYCHRVGRTARNGQSGRAVSLIGESDRKLMRMILKSTTGAKPKLRKVPHSVITRFEDFLKAIDPDVQRVIQVEKEEREIKQAEMDLKRAEQIMNGEGTISLKKNSWFKNKKADLPQSQVNKKKGGVPKRASGGAGGGGVKKNTSSSHGDKKPKKPSHGISKNKNRNRK